MKKLILIISLAFAANSVFAQEAKTCNKSEKKACAGEGKKACNKSEKKACAGEASASADALATPVAKKCGTEAKKCCKSMTKAETTAAPAN
ncbi:MAG: hypothetical protein MUE53_01660 [Chitinophagales bacterium]|jgi:hypothetical protein|nr:hypothetical protein [Chitinophagales bacterium]